MSRYPLRIFDERHFAPDWRGPVWIWDVDKTYLATGFSSLRGLARVPLELAVDKVALPGVPAVLRGLRRGPGPAYACAPLYFVTASPPQLRRVLAAKMLADGVEHDGLAFKDWLATLRRLAPGRLREQVGFKLAALLTLRLRRPASVEYLVGDDTERDAEAYSLYARLVAGELGAGAAEQAMTAAGVARADRASVLDLLDHLRAAAPAGAPGLVARIYIHLYRGRDPAAIAAAGPLVVPVRGAGQLALCLYEAGQIDRQCVDQVRAALLTSAQAADAAPTDLRALLRDALARGLVQAQTLRALDLPPG